MNLRFQTLASILIPMLGSTITRANLLIWPNEDGDMDTDTKLNLELKLVTDEELFITFGTEPDGQTPSIEREHVNNPKSFALLNERVKEWQKSIFADDGSCGVEYFEINSSAVFKGINGAIIRDIEMICYAETLAPAGLKLSLSSGAIIWSVSAGDGNRIFTEIPDPWFNDQMNFVSINVQLG